MTLRRWLALGGVVAPVLIVLGFTVVGGSTPDDKASAAKVVSYYRDHKDASMVAALMVAIGAVLLVLFAARLREVLRGGRSGSDLLPITVFGGFLILATGLLLMALVHFALVQAADHRFASPAQTLNVLDSNDFFVLLGGMCLVMLASGIAIVRRPVLPRWLGWTAIVVAVLSLAGPAGFFGLILGTVWIFVVAILIFTRDDETVVDEVDVTEVVVSY